MTKNKQTVDEVKEEFREAYKNYIMKTKGAWTEEDAKELEEQIQTIENNATLISCVIGCVVYILFILIVYFGFKYFSLKLGGAI